MAEASQTGSREQPPAPNATGLARYAGAIRWLAIGLFVLAVFVFMGALPVRTAIEAVEGVIRDLGVLGMALYALGYAVAATALVPGGVLTIGAGAIFGPLWSGWGILGALIVVVLGANTGATAAFLIARYLARERVRRWLYSSPRLAAVDHAVAEGGWKIVALLRLSPAVPFNLQNYLYGLTPIGLLPCVVTSLFTMLPGAFLFVYIGYLGRVSAEAAAGASESVSVGKWIFMGVGLLATLAVTVYLTRLAKKMLHKQAQLETVETQATETESSEPRGPSLRNALALLAAAVLALAAATGVRAADPFAGVFASAAAEPAEEETAAPEGAAFDHTAFDALLRKHVQRGGWVDYKALRADREKLQAYIDRLGDAPLAKMKRDQKLALLINAYNAFTLELILEHGTPDSIKDIPAHKRWEDRRWEVGGRTRSLDQIEHEWIRPKFEEPRIHFALVCAAVGCPPLRPEAYTAKKLEKQLRDQTVYVHTHPRWYRYDADEGVVQLTKLYDWYGDDFEAVADSVLAYAAQYAPRLKKQWTEGRRPDVQWLPYDWSLNSVRNRR